MYSCGLMKAFLYSYVHLNFFASLNILKKGKWQLVSLHKNRLSAANLFVNFYTSFIVLIELILSIVLILLKLVSIPFWFITKPKVF